MSSDMCDDAIKCNIVIATLGFIEKLTWNDTRNEMITLFPFLLCLKFSNCTDLCCNDHNKMPACDLVVLHF